MHSNGIEILMDIKTTAYLNCPTIWRVLYSNGVVFLILNNRLKKTKATIKNGKSRETSNIGQTKLTKTQHNSEY